MIYLDKSSVFRFWSWKANPGQGMAVSSYRDPFRWVTGWNMNILFNTIYRQFISMLVYTWHEVTLAKSLDTLLQILDCNTQSKDIVFMSIHLRYTYSSLVNTKYEMTFETLQDILLQILDWNTQSNKDIVSPLTQVSTNRSCSR